MRCILIVTSLIWSTTCMAQAKGEGRLKPQTSFLWSLEGLALKSIATDE